MKTVILAEKPSVGKEIARVLGCNKNIPGGIENNNYIITWALGHLVTLAMPEVYNKTWESWTEETLPMIPEKFKTVVIKESSKQFNNVKNILKGNDVKDLVIATDAGREGELVARFIIKQVGFSKPIKRLWISSMTDKAIKEGFQNLKPASFYDNLYYSAYARSKADWLVGLNVTRALTCKYNASLSAGRVQTPTLSMIVSREKEIKDFVGVPYFSIKLNYFDNNKKITFTYIDKRIFNEEKAKQIFNDVNNKNVIVENINNINKRKQQPLLYDLTELQRDANKIYGFSPKQTLDLMQVLYEKHKILTYPRTDSRYLPTDLYPLIKERIKLLGFGEFSNAVKEILLKQIPNVKRIFDDSKVSDHYAIIPTDQKPNIMNLSANERKIYELVVRRFLSIFLDEYKYQETEIILKVDKYNFTAKGITPLDLGWKKLYSNNLESDTDEEYQIMPSFKEKKEVKNLKVELTRLLTLPPARYTEATLLSAMEHPAQFVSGKASKDILEDTGGLGTPATRADIIEKLFNVGYLELRGKSIYPTSKGIQLINLVPEVLRSPLLTAEYETILKKIAEGKTKQDTFINDIIKETKQLVKEVLSSENNYKHDNMTKKVCPECNNNLLEVNNKQGIMLQCSNRNCKYRKYLLKHTELHCPTCKRKLDVIDGENKFYQCSCGFKEKAESFEKKLSDKKKEMSKKEVHSYLKNQEKDIPDYNPFADFFKK